MDPYREVMEVPAEGIYVELAGESIAGTDGYLVEIGQMLIDLTNIVTWREGVVDTLLQFGCIAAAIEQYGLSRKSVSSRTACFLKVSLRGVGTVVMDDEAHVRFVDTHAECVCGYDDTDGIVLPVVLSAVFLATVNTSMIVCGIYPEGTQVIGYFPCMASAAYVYDGRTVVKVQQVYELVELIGSMTDEV